MLEFTLWMLLLKLDLWIFQNSFVKYLCGVCTKKALSSWFNPCYSGIWRWHICIINVIVHLTICVNKVRPLTQYFFVVLDIQGMSAQKLLVENNLSNLTLASADDRLCYLPFELLDFLWLHSRHWYWLICRLAGSSSSSSGHFETVTDYRTPP